METCWIDKINSLIVDEELDFIKRKEMYLPKYLVKYRNASEQAINSLENDTVWFDKPSNYNDPYDCSITITGEIVKNHIENKIIEIESQVGKLEDMSRKSLYDFQFSGLIDSLNKHVQNSCLISCFSTSINSMLMWSHYANSHKGFCLVYDISEVDESSFIRRNLYPVIYNENKFDLSYYLDETLVPQYPFIASLCWKDKVWSYEDEYRIVIPCSDLNNEPKLYDFIKPKQIFLGSNIDKDDKNRIENIALDREIKVMNMSCDAQKYALSWRELLWKRRE